jgi:hypothetical protein
VAELAAGSARIYPAGQVLERLVGYDVALDPGHAAIWQLLGTGMPAGVVLTPSLWAGFAQKPGPDDLPQSCVSLMLQFKRPQYLDHWRAGQYDHWRRGYFRFHLADDQHARLESLERGVSGDALVRYAAPAFVAYNLLCHYTEAKEVCAHSTFVSPVR